MFRGRLVIGVIPARGGSKGLPGKNLMELGGKSLIARAAESAFGSGLVDIVVVSSDDTKILEHAETLTDVVAHRRSPLAADDTATAGDVIRDLLDSDSNLVMVDEDSDPWFVYLQPTSPLRTAEHVLSAFDALVQHQNANALVSVTAVDPKVFWTMRKGESGVLEPLFPEALSANRQSFDEVYRPNGAIYIFSLSEFKKTGKFPIQGAVPFVMAESESVDIDTQADFNEATRLLGE